MILVPVSDLTTYDGLKKPVRDEVERWLPLVNRVEQLAAVIGTVAALEQVAVDHQLKTGTLKTKYYAAKKDGWRGLVNRKKLGRSKVAINTKFRDYWHGLVLANQRNTATAYDRFLADYRNGEIIPGMPAPAERSGPLPRGCSLRNLRHHVPPKASIIMARQGIATARAFLPHAAQDISHIRPLEYVIFDDVELDFLIIVPECSTPVKLRLLVAMDLCSRVILGYGARPAVTREDGKEDGLKLRDMKAIVARLLRTWGVPLDYQMHFICERATASLPDAAKTALAEISGGKIIVHDTSMVVGQVFEFRDRSTGNSWGKAWLESFFNSLHGELADVPGQKGRRYDLAPAELDGRRKELAALVRAGKRLPIELRYQFRWPFKSGAEALQELDAALARLNQRTDHRLNCFEEIALWKATENDTWKSAAEMPDWMLPNAGNLLWDKRLEMPLERFNRLCPPPESRESISDCSLQRLMDEQSRVRYQSMQFAFERDRTDYVYLPSQDMLPLLKEGEHYLLWFHPQEMEVVYVTRDRPHLGYIGKLTRFTAGRRGELEDAKRVLQEKHRMFAHAQTAAQQSRISKLHQRAEDLDHNARLIREGIADLEVEVDVIAPGAVRESGLTTGSVAAMSQDMADHARTKKAVKSVDLVAETLKRPRAAKPAPAEHDWL